MVSLLGCPYSSSFFSVMRSFQFVLLVSRHCLVNYCPNVVLVSDIFLVNERRGGLSDSCLAECDRTVFVVHHTVRWFYTVSILSYRNTENFYYLCFEIISRFVLRFYFFLSVVSPFVVKTSRAYNIVIAEHV